MLRIRELREEAGKTQNEMANILCISRQVFANYENNVNQPSIETLCEIAKFFHCSVDYLIGYSDDFGTIPQNNTTNKDERELLAIYQKLNANEKQHILEFSRYLAQRK